MRTGLGLVVPTWRIIPRIVTGEIIAPVIVDVPIQDWVIPSINGWVITMVIHHGHDQWDDTPSRCISNSLSPWILRNKAKERSKVFQGRPHGSVSQWSSQTPRYNGHWLVPKKSAITYKPPFDGQNSDFTTLYSQNLLHHSYGITYWRIIVVMYSRNIHW